jgi:hypothetical protein
MELTDRYHRKKAQVTDTYDALQIDNTLSDALTTPSDEQPLSIRVRPFKDNEGIQGGIDLLESLHNPQTSMVRGTNQSPSHAYEARYTNGRINFQFVPHDEQWVGAFERQLKDKRSCEGHCW